MTSARRPARLLGLVAALALAGACTSAPHRGPAPAAPSAPSTTAPTTTATTAADPGLLPQTTIRPTGTDPVFLARIALLWRAVVSGDPSVALPAFFPRSAYLQVKALPNPAADWQNRLVATYDADLLVLHRSLGGAPATFLSVDVPDPAAVPVRPGQEYNKIGYWRVYGTVVRYSVGGRVRSFPIASLISWRGQWYVVHLSHLSR